MDNKENMEDRIKKLIIENSIISITMEDITGESDLINDFGFTSIAIIKFISEIEQEFNIEFEVEDLDMAIIGKYNSLKKYINYVIDKLNS